MKVLDVFGKEGFQPICFLARLSSLEISRNSPAGPARPSRPLRPLRLNPRFFFGYLPVANCQLLCFICAFLRKSPSRPLRPLRLNPRFFFG